MKNAYLYLLAALAACSSNGGGQGDTPPIPDDPDAAGGSVVTLEQRGGRWTLVRNGTPYTPHGAGLGGGDLAALAAHGGNSYRTWGIGSDIADARRRLDEAQTEGLTVALCVDVGKERHGFEYDDEIAVAAQLDATARRGHGAQGSPGAAGLGHRQRTESRVPEPEGLRCDQRHLEDDARGRRQSSDDDGARGVQRGTRRPHRHTCTGPRLRQHPVLRCVAPSAADTRRHRLGQTDPGDRVGYRRALGDADDRLGAPIELDSSAKADFYLESYEAAIATLPGQVLGSYAFMWGQKQERTPTWYGMFLADGSETEAVDVMHYIWTGAWPANRTPRVASLLLDSRGAGQDVTLAPGAEVSAGIEASDPDGDPLAYEWVLMRESSATSTGGDAEEVPEAFPALVTNAGGGSAAVTAPDEPGAYRLFVYIRDGNGNAAHANLPFLVQP